MRSFLANGHEFHLYTYHGVGDIPKGVVEKDANEIISHEKIFLVRNGYSSFSDFFRWKVVLDKGGWWADADTVCLRPWNLSDQYVFVGGLGKPGSADCVSSGMFKAPAGSPIMKWGWEQCQKMDPKTMTWGQAGPPLITEAVHTFGMMGKLIPAKLFFPVYYTNAIWDLTDPISPVIPPEAYSVHMFNEMWRLGHVDKNARYTETSLYEQLKRRFA